MPVHRTKFTSPRVVAKFGAICFVFVSSATANASPIVVQDDHLGNYELEWHDECQDECRLKESSDNGVTWTTRATGDYATAANYVVTDQPTGVYIYKVQDFEIDWEELEYIETWSGETTVYATNFSAADSIENQLNYSYETRVGTLNGLQSVLVNRTSGGSPGNGTLETYILQENTNGSFTSLYPTPSQLSAALSWPAVAADMAVTDYNMDGFVDILLKSAGQMSVNQIGFSSGQPGIPSVAIAATDGNFKTMVEEVAAFTDDQNFFAENADVTTTTIVATADVCYYVGNYLICHKVRVVLGTIDQFDFSGFNQDALAIARDMYDIVLAQDDLLSVFGNTRSILDRLSDLFGVPVLPSILSPGSWPFDPELEDLNEGLFTIFVALRDDVEPTDPSSAACLAKAWGNNPVTQQEHFGRNLNQAYCGNPNMTATSCGFEDVSNLPLPGNLVPGGFADHGTSKAHNLGTVSTNVDYRGKYWSSYRGWQLVYTDGGDVIREASGPAAYEAPENIGTYDFRSPRWWFNLRAHQLRDVTPWVEWGNTKIAFGNYTDDPSTKSERKAALLDVSNSAVLLQGIISHVLRGRYECL